MDPARTLDSDAIVPPSATRLALTIALVSMVGVIAQLLASPAVASIHEHSTSPFYARQRSSDDISAFSKWTHLLTRYAEQHEQAARECIGAACKNQQWEALLKRLATAPRPTQIDALNRFFNAMPYLTDPDNYGIDDRWQTPYELMARGGDCEDYAIAKYISLRRLGISQSAMRIIVVADGKKNGALHAVLEVTLDGNVMLLDNQTSTPLPLMRANHYQPMFAINEARWWLYR